MSHLSECEQGFSKDDLAEIGCSCHEKQNLHIANCNEYHAHIWPTCCSSICWCRKVEYVNAYDINL